MHGSGFHGKPTYRTIDDGDKEIEKFACQIISIINAKQGWGDFFKNVKNSFQEFFKCSCDMLMLLKVKVIHVHVRFFASLKYCCDYLLKYS